MAGMTVAKPPKHLGSKDESSMAGVFPAVFRRNVWTAPKAQQGSEQKGSLALDGSLHQHMIKVHK